MGYMPDVKEYVPFENDTEYARAYREYQEQNQEVA